jgi:hypothetical protein
MNQATGTGEVTAWVRKMVKESPAGAGTAAATAIPGR